MAESLNIPRSHLYSVLGRWILREYASKWLLVAAAIRAAYIERALPRLDNSLVIWRGASPRDFEGGKTRLACPCRSITSFPDCESLRSDFPYTLSQVLQKPVDVAGDESRTVPGTSPYSRKTLTRIRCDLPCSPRTLSWMPLHCSVVSLATCPQCLLKTAYRLIKPLLTARSAVPWVRVLDAYSIARARPDAHPGPDPKTNPNGRTDSLRHFDDCLHYCLPGIPDVYNGRLQTILEQTAAEAELKRQLRTDASSEGAASKYPTEDAVISMGGDAASGIVEGVPGTVIARWNFEFGRAQFVQGEAPRISLQLGRLASPAPLDCPLRAPGIVPRGIQNTNWSAKDLPPLLGICSDLDSHLKLVRGSRNSTSIAHILARTRRARATIMSKASAARRANKAHLLETAPSVNIIKSMSGIKASTKAGMAVPKDEWVAAG